MQLETELDDSLKILVQSRNKHRLAFATHGEEHEYFSLMTIEIAEVQRKDQELKVYCKKNAIIPKKDNVFS